MFDEISIYYITENLIDEEPIEKMGNLHHTPNLKKSDLKKLFRLRDDDGITYFKGYSNDSNSFFPLDTLGVSYGCNEIQYYQDGKWETL